MATQKQIKAVGYARRSTDMQERSIPDQKAYIEKWAAQNGYRIIRWYVDDAISGASAKGRVAFEQMIAAAENGRDFETILCYDISRFSRGGTNETGYFLHRLQMAGVDTIFCADGIPEGDEGELLQGVKSWQAKQYAVKLSRDVIRGQMSNMTVRRSAPGGPPPYGYDKQHIAADGTVLRTFRTIEGKQKMEFDGAGKLIRILKPGELIRKSKSDICRFVPSTPERVEVVKRMFEASAAGQGCPRIAHMLNEEGYRNLNGGRWTAAGVRDILLNPTYRGAIVWNKCTMGRFHGVDGNGNIRPKRGYTSWHNKREDWIVVEGVHEPLVSPEDFEKSLNAIAERDCVENKASRVNRGPNNRALLAGLIRCVHCGMRFHQAYCYVYSGKVKKKFYYYRDTGYPLEGHGGRCKFNQVPLFLMNRFVLQQAAIALLGDKKSLEAAIKQFIASVRRSQKSALDTSSDQKKLDAITKQIEVTISMLGDPEFSDLEELKKSLMALKQQRDAIVKNIERAQTQPNRIATDAELREFAIKCFSGLKDIDPEQRNYDSQTRDLIRAVIDRIEIDGNTKTGTIYLCKDLYQAYQNTLCSLAGRGDNQGFFKKMRNEQSDLSLTVLDRLFSAWRSEAALVEGLLPSALRTTEPIEHEWFFDGVEHVDPVKEAHAQQIRLQSNTTTLAAEYARQGKDWQTELVQRAKEKDLLRQLGLADAVLTPTLSEQEDSDA